MTLSTETTDKQEVVDSSLQEGRALATIQLIEDVFPIEGADAIEGLKILGWYCVGKKGEFAIGDKCVFFEIDSILPEAEPFEFMRPRKFRVKTAKFRKQISQGLALTLPDVLPHFGELDTTDAWPGKVSYDRFYPKAEKWSKNRYDYERRINLNVGADLTEALGVTKHDPEGESLQGAARKRELQPSFAHRFWLVRQFKKYSYFAKRAFYQSAVAKALGIRNPYEAIVFPTYVPKTDETRVQNLGRYLAEHKGQRGYTSEKCEGQSLTVSRKGKEVRECSRNMDMSHDENSNWVKMSRKYELVKKLLAEPKDYAIQAEIIGPGVQGNLYGLKELEIRVFYIFDIAHKRKLNYEDFIQLCNKWGLPTVPILDADFELPGTVDELVAYSVGKSKLNPKKDREGIIFVAHNPDYGHGWFSCKAINPQYLLKQVD
jgi:hypothetical protein